MSSLRVENFVLKRSKSENEILKDINAEFKSGQLCAIMGPNGSGKTTLFNALIGITESDIKTSGRILYNEEERDEKTWFKEATLVNQFGCEFPDQTVEELLSFSIALFESSNKNYQKDEAEKLFSTLDIKKLFKMKYSNLSGGEQKRVRIARDLLLKKNVVILDEPLSDLDNNNASSLIKYLKSYAKNENAMVIMTIHQPSGIIFDEFDNVLFIDLGHKIFSGDRKELVDFFKGYGLIKPDNLTTADFVFEILAKNPISPEVKAMKEKIQIMKADLRSKVSQNLENPVYKGSQSILNLNFNFSEYLVIMKRMIKIIFASKTNLITIFWRASSFCLLFFVFSCLYTTFNFVTNSLGDVSQIVSLANSSMNSKLALIATVSIVSTMPYSSLTPFNTQFKDEISKGFYSTFTLMVSYLSFEAFQNILIYLIFLIFLIAMGYTDMFTFRDLPLFFFVFVFKILDDIILNALKLHSSIFFTILKTLLTIISLYGPIMFSFDIFKYIPDEFIRACVKNTVSFILFFSKPTILISYLLKFEHLFFLKRKASSFKKIELKVEADKFIDEQIKEINESYYPIIKDLDGNDIYKALGLLLFSFTIILTIYMIIFSYFFAPRLSLKTSSKNFKFSEIELKKLIKKKQVIVSFFFALLIIGILIGFTLNRNQVSSNIKIKIPN